MPCDVCGKPLNMKDAKIVPPNQMRLWAHNGYGETIGLLAGFPVKERRSKFLFLTNSNDTDWAVCPKCYVNAGPYMEDANPGGMSQRDLDAGFDLAMRPLLNAVANAPRERGAPSSEPPMPGAPTLLRALETYLDDDHFGCPSCRRDLLFAECAARATSPSLADVPDWETAQAGARLFGLISDRLAAIKTSGFREAMTREEADVFECSSCGVQLSLARAFDGQYPKPGRAARSGVARAGGDSRRAPAQSKGCIVPLAVLIGVSASAAWRFFA